MFENKREGKSRYLNIWTKFWLKKKQPNIHHSFFNDFSSNEQLCEENYISRLKSNYKLKGNDLKYGLLELRTQNLIDDTVYKQVYRHRNLPLEIKLELNTDNIARLKMNDEQKNLFGIDKLNVKRSDIPAVTHVDYSARIQTVTKNTNSRYYDLISKFKEKTGCPILVNTSFNVRGEPIVNTPTDAFNCFMGTELDYLVIGNCILDKSKQDPNLKKDYTKEFKLD